MAPHCSTCCCQPPPQVSLKTTGLPDAVKAHTLSNEPPSPSDVLMLRKCRLSIDGEIAALSAMQEKLEKELDLRKATLDALQTERRLLEERQQHIAGALSPVRCLPFEILQEMFLCLLVRSSEPGYTWFDVFDREDPLWTVRRVSRNWRTATEYPHLWTGLQISRTSRGNLSVVRDVLDRSRSLPLRIRFTWEESRKVAHFGGIVLEELIKHSERWQYASFNGVGRAFTRLISTVRGRLPKLRELEFSHSYHLTLTDYNEEDHPFEIAPSLTQASIGGAVVKLDYSRLESFTSNAFTPAAFKVLVSSPYLTYLADHFSRAMPNDDSSPNKTRYLHSRLSTLLLQQCSQLNMFILPNLQHLTAGEPYARELSPSLPAISQFLHVSRCPLLSLILNNCELSIGSMPELLQLVPRLQSLSININGRTMASGVATSTDEALNALLRSLAERASNEFSLVPKLESFSFRSCLQDPWRFVDASIVDMICVRSGMASVSFIVHPKSRLPNLSDDDIACLRTIKEDGFNISILKKDMEYMKAIVLI